MVGSQRRLPWWCPLLGAAATVALVWFLLPVVARGIVPRDPLVIAFQLGVQSAMLKNLAGVFVVLCVAKAVVSWFKVGDRRRLLGRQRDLETLREMDWKAFERLVGEAYRRFGYRIVETGQGGADGGIDLILLKNGQKTLVQVKQWKTGSVGASVVREMFGLMVHHGADAVVIVCLGTFTNEAWKFAQGKRIELVAGKKLLEMVKAAQGIKD